MPLPRPAAPRAAVRSGAALVAAGALALTTGCAVSPVVNQFSTELEYAPSDGVSASVVLQETTTEQVQQRLLARNLLLLGAGEDQAAALYGVLVNESLEEVSAVISGPGGLFAEVVVPPRSSVPLTEVPEETVGVPPLEAPEGAETTGTLVADPVGHQPGTLAELTIAVGDEALEVSVPLLDATLPEYDGLLPAEDA